MADSFRETETRVPAPSSTPVAPPALLRLLIPYAIQAPSLYNTQPWQFRIAQGAVAVYADRRRMLPRIDPAGRQMILSCGAALFYLRLALRHFGYVPQVALLPDPTVPDLLAQVRPGPLAPPAAADEALCRAIPERHTNRQPFFEWKPPAALLATLQTVVAAEGAQLYLVEDAARRAGLAAFIAEGDRILWADPAFRQELARWVHPNQSSQPDGISGAGLGMGELVSALAPILVRTLDMGLRQAENDRRLAEAGPVLAVLGTREDTPAAWLAAGQSLAHLLLAASAAGGAASFLNQAIEVPALRPLLVTALGQPTCPQVLLRLGYGPPAPVTARRPGDEALG